MNLIINNKFQKQMASFYHVLLCIIAASQIAVNCQQQQQQQAQQQQQQHQITTSIANECTRRPNICQNGATCLSKPDGYQCICVNGWTGQNCSENVDDCSTAACEAGATCHDLVGRFHCECPYGKTGIRCHLDDQCVTKSPCHVNATCDTSFTDGQAICTCPAGFTGSDCSIDTDECAAGSPCEHGGLCINTPGSFRCQCQPGFEGSRCEININECDNNPCMNEGTCLDEKGGYKCICMPGFTGQKCQIDIDECASNPCQNGAICKDSINSFRCVCQPNYWGNRCEFHAGQIEGTPPADTLSPSNPWSRCSNPYLCWTAFKDGKCDQECNTAECLYDGNDCPPRFMDTTKQLAHPPVISRSTCDEKSDSYCLKNYANGICDHECNNAECGWDGADCETIANELMPYSTMAQGLLVIRVEPAIEFNTSSEISKNVELARLLRKVSVKTNTILKIQKFTQVEDGTEIELIADTSKCQASCYNSTALIANFLSALKTRTRDLEPKNPNAGELIIRSVDFKPGVDSFRDGQPVWSYIVVGICAVVAVVAALIMVVSVNGKRSVKEKATVWFPEGFIKPVLSSRNRDPTDRKPGRGVSTLQALGGNFFRGIKRNERNISTNPSGLNSTEIDRCTTPNGGGIYHEPYDQYDQYGTYNGTDGGSVCFNGADAPMTPTPMTLDPINLEGPQGLTPLMIASMATPFSKEPLGLVAYGTTGEMNGNIENNVTDLLQRGAQLNLAKKDTGETALHLAARFGRADTARSLLERCDSQDVNAQDKAGRTPLHAAIAADSQGVFELLIRCRGTDLNAQTNDGTTPLIQATKSGTNSMLEELIQNECEVTKSDANGRTALHWAAATDNVEAIRILLDVRETNKDAQDLAEQTPLFLAAKEGARNAVEILLKNNANKDISDQMDQSPIEIARTKGHNDIARLLEEHEPPTPKSINSMHHSNRQMSPFSPIADSNSNSNSSSGPPPPPPPSYHSHTHSGGIRQGGRQAQRAALARSNSTKPLIAEANIIRNNYQNHCKSTMVIKEDKDSNNRSMNTRETKTLGRRTTQSVSSSHQAIQPSMHQVCPFGALSANNVVMPATPNSLTNSLSPVSTSMMSPPNHSLHHLNSPTKPNPPINQLHRHYNSQGNHMSQHAVTNYDECQTYWNNNNNNPNMVNVNNNIMEKTHGISEVYNVPSCIKNPYMTPSPDSPFSPESMASPPGAYPDQQYQNPNHTSQQQVQGVFI